MPELPIAWAELHSLLERTDGLTTTEFTRSLVALHLPTALKEGLRKAHVGNTSDLIRYLFTAPQTAPRDPVVLLVPIDIDGKKRHAWMIGCIASLLAGVRRRFVDARDAAQNDPLLLNAADPPSILFVTPYAVSDVQTSAGARLDQTVDDFAIFRTGKVGDEEDDVDQRIVLDLATVRKNLLAAYAAGNEVFGNTLSDVQASLHADVELFGMLHAEGHNRGHFAGPWPFNAQKSSLMHEAVEEFRACLCAIRWCEHLGLTSLQKDAFATSIFLTRFLFYGQRAYQRDTKTRQSIREISVGLMFFETLRRAGAIQEGANARLLLKPQVIRAALEDELSRLHQKEREARPMGATALREVSRELYHIAYPCGNLSSPAHLIYERR